MKIILDFVTNSSEADYYNECYDCDCDCDYDCDYDCYYDCDYDCDCDCDYDCDCYDYDCEEHYGGLNEYRYNNFPDGYEGDSLFEEWLNDFDD